MRTYDGFLYVATDLDLFSRRIVGWSLRGNINRHPVIDALLIAKIRRQLKHAVLLHSDQGGQYGSHDYTAFMEANNLFRHELQRRLP